VVESTLVILEQMGLIISTHLYVDDKIYQAYRLCSPYDLWEDALPELIQQVLTQEEQ
jgi:hypothetical protein